MTDRPDHQEGAPFDAAQRGKVLEQARGDGFTPAEIFDAHTTIARRVGAHYARASDSVAQTSLRDAQVCVAALRYDGGVPDPALAGGLLRLGETVDGREVVTEIGRLLGHFARLTRAYPDTCEGLAAWRARIADIATNIAMTTGFDGEPTVFDAARRDRALTHLTEVFPHLWD